MNEQQPLIKKASADNDSQNSEEPVKLTKKFIVVVAAYVIYSLVAGFKMALLPPGKGWRLFSWHPLLMVFGTIGMMGVSLSTKKLGGYKNTKTHGILATAGLLMAFGGLYAIYKNKNLHGKPHFKSLHAVLGIVTLVGMTFSMLAGLIFLHPDFGTAKKDKKKRFVHKLSGRVIVLLGWITCFHGLHHLTRKMENNNTIVAVYAAPLLFLAPFTLI